MSFANIFFSVFEFILTDNPGRLGAVRVDLRVKNVQGIGCSSQQVQCLDI